jgi:hypothetical protein
MRNINSAAESRPISSPAHQTYNRGKRLFTAFIFIFFTCFIAFSQPANAPVNQQKQIDPEDMVQNGIYFFADHGNGMSVAKFDRMEGDNVYTFAAIRPLLLSFTGSGLWGTVSEAGNIRLATPLEIVHLLLCIVAGVYVEL